MKLFAFPKDSRIRTSSQFRTVLDHGKKWVRPEIIVFVLPTEGVPAAARLGLIVSRKVGKAHDRNLVKRRLREIFRTSLRSELAANADIVVIARERAAHSDYNTLHRSLSGGVAKALSHKLATPKAPAKILVTAPALQVSGEAPL